MIEMVCSSEGNMLREWESERESWNLRNFGGLAGERYRGNEDLEV